MSSIWSSLVLIPLAAALSPLIAAIVGRAVRVPLVVFEIVLGVVIGPNLLGWVKPNDFVSVLSNIGLSMLFFLAGNEVDFTAIRGRPLNRAATGWVISLGLGLGAGILIGHTFPTALFIAIALSSTALGALLPMLRDAGELGSPYGRAVFAVGVAGEFGPLAAISLFLSGRAPVIGALLLALFVVITAAAIWMTARGTPPALHKLIAATLHTSGQFAVRLVLLILAALTFVSVAFGLDALLGAFAAGVLCRVLLSGAGEAEREVIQTKIEAVGFGLLVPIFFISTGITFNLQALIADPRALLLVPLFMALFLLIRGLPSLLALPRASRRRDKGAMVLFGSTALPIIIAVTTIATKDHALPASVGAALVAAGMLTILIFPASALAIRTRGSRTAAEDDISEPG